MLCCAVLDGKRSKLLFIHVKERRVHVLYERNTTNRHQSLKVAVLLLLCWMRGRICCLVLRVKKDGPNNILLYRTTIFRGARGNMCLVDCDHGLDFGGELMLMESTTATRTTTVTVTVTTNSQIHPNMQAFLKEFQSMQNNMSRMGQQMANGDTPSGEPSPFQGLAGNTAPGAAPAMNR